MKKIGLSLVCFLFSTQFIIAQNNISNLSFGGISTGNNVSIMQVLDYPKLISKNKNISILSYQLRIEAVGNATQSFEIKNNILSQNAKEFLNSLHDKKGTIYIENIKLKDGAITPENAKLTYTFNK